MDTLIMEEKRFNKIYWLIVVFGAFILALISCLVFCHIPKDNQQSANMALAFFMSAFTALIGYLIGASPDKKRGGDAPAANTTAKSVTVTETESNNKTDTQNSTV